MTRQSLMVILAHPEEAPRLACHEYFTLAGPAVASDTLACLFAPLTDAVPA